MRAYAVHYATRLKVQNGEVASGEPPQASLTSFRRFLSLRSTVFDTLVTRLKGKTAKLRAESLRGHVLRLVVVF